MYSSDISTSVKLSLNLGNKYPFMHIPWNLVINYYSPNYSPDSLDLGNKCPFMRVPWNGVINYYAPDYYPERLTQRYRVKSERLEHCSHMFELGTMLTSSVKLL